ncbi:TIGR03086 family metal-binding protein [Streptomyces sp. NPDC050560]|uniref:TIGR03086 family metal-binding protein n=1 Tax=Streptomyces sp. NPDC050560 TaxID=3365630 RepID=UPI00378C821E
MAVDHRNPLLARHAAALDLFTDRVHRITPEQWEHGTPCTDWSIHDLVNHLTAEQLWVPPLVRDGATTGSVGRIFDGDMLGPEPVRSWDTAAEAAREAFAERGALGRTVHLSYGDTSATAYCSQMIADLVVHSWDLSRAVGADERLPDDLVAFSVREVTPYAAELEASGLFGPPAEPPPGAGVQTKLLCLLGRKP